MAQKQKTTELHRKELLNKLESIIKILNDKVEADSPIPTLRETIDTSKLIENEPDLLNDSLKNPATLESTNQPSLFEGASVQKKSPSESIGNPNQSTNSPTKTDNPFLPRHLRTRRYDEDKKKPSPKKSSSEASGGVNSPKGLHDAIIDSLIAFYLPQIEADLRRRLKALATKETHNKTQ